MDDKTRIKNLEDAVALLLPHAESLRDQREIEARDKPTVTQSADWIRRDIDQARALSERPE